MRASSSVSPATKRRAIRRGVGVEGTQWAKPGLSERFSRVARSIKLYYACCGDDLLGQHFYVVLFQELFCVHGGHAAGARSGHAFAVAGIPDGARDNDPRAGPFSPT